MEPTLGRITGRGVGELHFRVGPDEVVRLGELLVADSRRGLAAPFYLRVTDIVYGNEARDAAWTSRTAGALMGADEDVVLFDREERLFQTVIAAPLGHLHEGRFRAPKALPDMFCPVRRPAPDDFAFLAPGRGDLELGHLRSGDEALSDTVGLDPRALAQHVGIFATTGMGKSNLLKVLAGSCLESGRVGLLLLDPHGEYADGGGGHHRDGTPHRGLLHHARRDRLSVYTSRPIAGHSVHSLKVSAAEVQVSDFQNIYHVSEAQGEALWAIGARFGRSWLSDLAPTPVDALDRILGENRFHPSTLNVLQRRADQLLQQPVMHEDKDVSTTPGILRELQEGKVVLIDTSGLYPREELLISAVLARRVLETHRAAYREPETFAKMVPVCVTLEEAQRVLNARGGSQNVFAQIAREGRKFKVGLGAVTQQPRLISDELLSQFNTLLILGLADPTDRERVRSGARQDLSRLDKELQMLEPGEALVTTPGAPFALPVKAHLYEQRVPSGDAGAPAATRPDEEFF